LISELQEKYVHMIDVERQECKKLRLRALEAERDYSTLVKEVTDKAKFDAKQHSDSIIVVAK